MTEGRWEFGTIVRHGDGGELVAMVVHDYGDNRSGNCNVKLISLSGRQAEDAGGFYAYGNVWEWHMTRRSWTVVSEP